MGRYDDISSDRLRRDLVAFAELILRLDRENGVLTSPADLQKLLGELRQKLFAYEVGRSRPPASADSTDSGTEGASARAAPAQDSTVEASLRIVREARRRTEQMIREWRPEGSGDEEEDEAGA